MKQLISMTGFVLEQETLLRNNSDYTNAEAILKCINYANFLKQPLELWIFVPCDEDGNVLELPDNEDMQYWDLHQKNIFNEDKNKYQQSKERCLFEGFEFTESQKFSTVNKIKISVHCYTKDRLYLTTKKEDGYHSYFQLFTIEDLIQCDLQLTPTAIKQIGL